MDSYLVPAAAYGAVDPALIRHAHARPNAVLIARVAIILVLALAVVGIAVLGVALGR